MLWLTLVSFTRVILQEDSLDFANFLATMISRAVIVGTRRSPDFSSRKTVNSFSLDLSTEEVCLYGLSFISIS
jgi:hypothetical protein